MDVVIDMGKAREIVGNAELWPRVRDFLWDFAPQVHESWIEGLAGQETLGARREVGSSQVSCLMSSSRVKKFILDSLGVEPCFHDFPKDDGSRLLLLDGKTLERLVQWLGALVCVDELRRVTDGATVRALKTALPGVYPDVFGYTVYFPFGPHPLREETRNAAESTSDSIANEGCGILLSAIGGLPDRIVSRLKYKLPKRLCSSVAPQEPKESAREKNLSLILKLLKLKFPEEFSLCCF